MAYQSVRSITVNAWGRHVGAAAIDPGTGFVAFEYSPSWVRSGTELSPILLPNRPGARVFPDLPEVTYRRLPALLADALPDRFGSSLLEAYLANEGVAPGDITPLDRLAYLGTRAMGALEFAPPTGPEHDGSTAYAIANLVDEARNAIMGSFGNEDDAAAGIRSIIELGSSAGGLRAKAIIAWNQDTGEIRAGHNDSPEGFSHWLLKLDGVNDDKSLGETTHAGCVEYAYSQMAQAAGIDMMEGDLLREHGRAHFVTRRYDRIGNQRIHAQTLCGLAGLDFREIGVHDYSEYLQTARTLEIGADAEKQAFARAAFNVMAANRDDHTKNFAFLLPQTGPWRLAPAYDITYTGWLHTRMTSVNGNFTEVTVDDLRRLADRFEIGDTNGIVQQVADAVSSWSQFAATAGLPTDVTDRIGADIRPLTRLRPRSAP